MGKKLTAEEIDQLSIDNPLDGFDICYQCNEVETQNSMLDIGESDRLICEECSDNSINIIEKELSDKIDEVFVTAHEVFKTDSGDITPEQTIRLNSLRAQVLDLILEQVKQNLK